MRKITAYDVLAARALHNAMVATGKHSDAVGAWGFSWAMWCVVGDNAPLNPTASPEQHAAALDNFLLGDAKRFLDIEAELNEAFTVPNS